MLLLRESDVVHEGLYLYFSLIPFIFYIGYTFIHLFYYLLLKNSKEIKEINTLSTAR